MLPYTILLYSNDLCQSRDSETRTVLEKSGMTLRSKTKSVHPKGRKSEDQLILQDAPTKRRMRSMNNTKNKDKKCNQGAGKARQGDGVDDSLVELDVVWNTGTESAFDLASVTIVVKSSNGEQPIRRSRNRNHRISTSPSHPIHSRTNTEEMETGEARAIILMGWVQEVVEACMESPGTIPPQVSSDPPLILPTSHSTYMSCRVVCKTSSS